MQSLGIIETVSLTAAVEAADVAVKSANVELVGYELAKGGGYVTVKVVGNVGAVKAALSAAKAAASKINRVVSCRVIARPDPQIESMVYSTETVGYSPAPTPAPKPEAAAPKAAPATKPKAASTAKSRPAPKKATPAAKKPSTEKK